MQYNLKTKTVFFMILGIIFALSLIINNNLNFNAGNSDKSSEYSDDINFDNENLKISALSGKIHIDTNWTAAKNAGICTGNGTYSEPYVIEDLVIDGGYSGNCIWIRNSDVYFRIENCTLYNSGANYGDAGIRLIKVSNGQIIDNDCSNNRNFGIFLSNYCNNNTISGNTANSNDNGIVLSYSDNNTLSGNIANNNYNWYGIDLYSSDNNTLSGNNATSNLNGIVLFYSDNNILSENIANSNNYNGIYLHGSHYNTVTQNMMKYNSFTGGAGLGIPATGDSSSGNSIFLNCFINNSKNAHDEGLNNNWDNGIKGNYWSDYTGSDAGGDGIGDVPYTITGQAGSQDNFPLMKCPIQEGGGIPLELIILISVISGGAVVGVVAILLIRRKRKRIE